MSVISKGCTGHITMSAPTGTETQTPVPTIPPDEMREYLRERRRAIITELRMIEQMLNMRPSIPLRDRPH